MLSNEGTAMSIDAIKRKLIANRQNLLMVAFLLVVACSNPVAHIPEINPEQLRAAPINDPPPTERTYKMVPYDQSWSDLLTTQNKTLRRLSPFALTETSLWTASAPSGLRVSLPRSWAKKARRRVLKG